MSEAKMTGPKIPDLAGKAVLITGASAGIGAALARAFAAQSARVAIHYNSGREAAEAIVKEIEGAGGEAVAVQGDVSKAENVARVVEEAATKLGGLDGLINNAGNTFERRAYADMIEDYYDAVMNLNARSVVFACRAAIPHLKKNGGFIINTSSLAARNGASGGMGLYGSAKAFVSNYTRGLAKELIPHGIRVNAVAPGFIHTRIHDLYSTDTHWDAALATIPQGRVGTPEDCVGAYLFLASPSLSGYIVGQVIEVNGGQLMR
jgi:3-oxoacyl-[acyl-carrier protein] reductase